MDNRSDIFSSGIHSQAESERSFNQNASRAPSNRLSSKSDFEPESFVRSLLQLRKQFSAIKSMLRKNKLNEEKLQVAQSWGLQRVFQIRCPELLEMRKDFFNHCQSFFKKMSQTDFQQIQRQSKRNPNALREKKGFSEDEPSEEINQKKVQIPPNFSEEERVPGPKNQSVLGADTKDLTSSVLNNPYLKDAINKDEVEQKHLSMIHRPIEENVIDSINQAQKKEEKRQQRQKEQEKKQEKREEEKKKEDLGNEDDKLKKKLEEINFHLNWQNKAAFHVQDKVIRKLHNNDYRKICALDPFKDGIVYNIKFKILKMGTVAFGIVSKENKGGLFIDNRYTDTLKFITFFNGDGGKMILNGEELLTGKALGMAIGNEVQFVLDFKQWKGSFKTTRMRNAETVDLVAFKGQQMYAYVEMKQQGTTIEFL